MRGPARPFSWTVVAGVGYDPLARAEAGACSGAGLGNVVGSGSFTTLNRRDKAFHLHLYNFSEQNQRQTSPARPQKTSIKQSATGDKVCHKHFPQSRLMSAGCGCNSVRGSLFCTPKQAWKLVGDTVLRNHRSPSAGSEYPSMCRM